MPTEMNILLVEDSDLDAMILERTLKRLDLPATVVRESPFLILLDINMPRMNGHDFLSALRANPDTADQIVFMFTTSDNHADIAEAYKHNVSGYFIKPQGAAELKTLLTSLFRFWEICQPPVPSPA